MPEHSLQFVRSGSILLAAYLLTSCQPYAENDEREPKIELVSGPNEFEVALARQKEQIERFAKASENAPSYSSPALVHLFTHKADYRTTGLDPFGLDGPYGINSEKIACPFDAEILGNFLQQVGKLSVAASGV